MANDRVVKSISFKTSDKWEAELLEHCKEFGNFSNYVKRLIQRDKDGIQQPIAEKTQTTPIADDDKNAMETFF